MNFKLKPISFNNIKGLRLLSKHPTPIPPSRYAGMTSTKDLIWKMKTDRIRHIAVIMAAWERKT
jgi:hypothetical protein